MTDSTVMEGVKEKLARRLSAEVTTHPTNDFAAAEWPSFERAASGIGDLVPMLQQPASTRFHRERRSTVVTLAARDLERTRAASLQHLAAPPQLRRVTLAAPPRPRRVTAAQIAGRRSTLRTHLPEPTQVEDLRAVVDDNSRRESVAAPAASQLAAAPAVVPSVVSVIKRQRSIDHQLAAATEPPAAAPAAVNSVEVGAASEAAAPEADEGGGAVCVVVLELPLRGGEDPAAHYARCGEVEPE